MEKNEEENLNTNRNNRTWPRRLRRRKSRLKIEGKKKRDGGDIV